jgi:hypothetical protein
MATRPVITGLNHRTFLLFQLPTTLYQPYPTTIILALLEFLARDLSQLHQQFLSSHRVLLQHFPHLPPLQSIQLLDTASLLLFYLPRWMVHLRITAPFRLPVRRALSLEVQAILLFHTHHHIILGLLIMEIGISLPSSRPRDPIQPVVRPTFARRYHHHLPTQVWKYPAAKFFPPRSLLVLRH